MRFTYASIGQPGSMHDTSVLFHALRHEHDKFPHPPQGMFIYHFRNYKVYVYTSFVQFNFALMYAGKYYHVDARYPNRHGYLAPYKGERYHVPDWRRGPAPSGQQEMFNHLHSSIRNVV
jgi:hypothetical protein